MIPIVQKEIDTFVDVVWNSHRIRDKKIPIFQMGCPIIFIALLTNMDWKNVVCNYNYAIIQDMKRVFVHYEPMVFP